MNEIKDTVGQNEIVGGVAELTLKLHLCVCIQGLLRT